MTALFKLLSCVGVALSSALPSVVQAKSAYVPSYAYIGDAFDESSFEYLWNRGATYEAVSYFNANRSYRNLSDDLGGYNFWWVQSAKVNRNSGPASVTGSQDWVFGHVVVPWNSVNLSPQGIWPYILGGNRQGPSFAGYVSSMQYRGEQEDYLWNWQGFGMVDVFPSFYDGHGGSVSESYRTMVNDEGLVVGYTTFTLQLQLDADEYSDFATGVLDWPFYVAGRSAAAYDFYTGSALDTAYNDGYKDGKGDTIQNGYQGLTYDQIYQNGFGAGVAYDGNIEVIDMFGMFSAVVTMPFTLMASTFDADLFAGTPYAFNVSVFIYSVFIILLVWKILGLIFMGASGGK